MPADVRYVFEGQPEPGETREVAQGVHWLRMPLPFKLDHINLWLLADGDGWTIVDTGINRAETRDAWKKVFTTHLGERPLKRVIVTHFHPDHMGLAGWLTERFNVPLWAPLAEWAFGRMVSLDAGDESRQQFRRFYQDAGFDDAMLILVEERFGGYARRVSPLLAKLRRIRDGEVFEVDGRGWRVIVGTGHSPEHACLYCEDLGVLISGDQILPRISPNISVWPQEPEANPLRLYLDSLPRYRALPDDTLVLPSHDWPFTGLHARLEALAHHHDDRLDETLAACAEPVTAVGVLKRLFTRELDSHQLFFAAGESLAHLHFLAGQGRIEERRHDGGPWTYHRTEAPAAER